MSIENKWLFSWMSPLASPVMNKHLIIIKTWRIHHKVWRIHMEFNVEYWANSMPKIMINRIGCFNYCCNSQEPYPKGVSWVEKRYAWICRQELFKEGCYQTLNFFTDEHSFLCTEAHLFGKCSSWICPSSMISHETRMIYYFEIRHCSYWKTNKNVQ